METARWRERHCGQARIGAADLAWTNQFAENAIMEHPLPALSGLISPHDR
jgi:hypothetical protein